MKKAATLLVAVFLGGSSAVEGGRRASPCIERWPTWATTEPENAEPAWSPDGRSLAFQSNRTGTSQIFVFRLADCSVRQVTRVGKDAEAPDWSPDGRRIVFSMLDRGLWVVNADGTGVSQLIGGDAGSPSWSPNGRTIVFARGYPNYRLLALPVNGVKTRLLARGYSPAWSPDGRRLAFVGNDDATWIMRADGTSKRRITRGTENGDQEVAWSPDGRRLVIAHSTVGRGLTLFIKTLGGELRHVRGSGNAWAPDWSPNGRAIAFTRVTADNASDLFVIRPRGGAARRLTVTPGTTG